MPASPTPRDAARTAECALPDGRTLAYAVIGDPDDAPVFVHHGTPGSRLFSEILAAAGAPDGVRLLVPDRPGYGRSSPPPAGWAWTDWPADLAAIRRVESVDRAAHVGFSGGGPFALAAATADWTSRVALVSSVVPPAENGLATLSKIPFALRALFRLSGALASLTGSDGVVAQYTDRDVPDRFARAVGADFHEALRQGASAVAREYRLFAEESIDPNTAVPVRCWHGTRDSNAAIESVRTLAAEIDAELTESDADHLGTLLDHQDAVFDWLTADRRDSTGERSR